MLEIGPVYIPRAIRMIGPNVRQASEQALDDIATKLVVVYKQEITAVNAIDTGFFIDTVKVRSARYGERNIASDAFYSGIVEFGWIHRARGQDSYPGRWPASRAIDRMYPFIEQAFDRQLRRMV